MFCSKCGNKLEEGSKFCNKCGKELKLEAHDNKEAPKSNEITNNYGEELEVAFNKNNKGSINNCQENDPKLGCIGIFLCFIAFLFPLLGLIFYVTLLNSSRSKARTVGAWTIAGVLFTIIFWFLVIVPIIVGINS